MMIGWMYPEATNPQIAIPQNANMTTIGTIRFFSCIRLVFVVIFILPSQAIKLALLRKAVPSIGFERHNFWLAASNHIRLASNTTRERQLTLPSVQSLPAELVFQPPMLERPIQAIF